MKATKEDGVGGNPMWKVEGATNYYLVFKGLYTQHRILPGGRATQASIMHDRFAGLRARIDSAIATMDN